MAPSRKKGARAAAAAAAARQQWKVGDLVLAKMKGFPAWPAMVSEPEKWGFSSDRKKLLVYFYGTKQIAFCNYADIEAFTEEKKKSLLVKRQGKGADFVRAVEEIIDIYDKKQNHAEFNSSDEGVNSNNGKCEGSKSKSIKRSPEIQTHGTNKNQAEALCASPKDNDVINHQVISRTSEDDVHDASLATNEPTEKVSILDQLRQTPLSTTTTTRKRQRDGSVVQRVPSLRRSRSSSGRDSHKFHKSSKTGNSADQASCEVVCDVLHEESTLQKRLSGEVADSSLCSNGDIPVSTSLPSNCSTEEGMVSDVVAVRSDAEEDSMSESSFKFENSDEYLDKDQGSNGGVTLNENFDLPIKTAIFKKKRKPNRKRVTSTQACATVDREADLHVQLQESLSNSANSCKEVVDNISKANGDEHLPLVKRARVRMGKPPPAETQVDDFAGKPEILQVEDSGKTTKSSSPHKIGDKDVTNSSLINGCTQTAGRDSVFWKVKKRIALNDEAALPPSKRLHRALEAMKSANAAEATDDTPETSNGMEVMSNGCPDSPKTESLHVDGSIRSPTSTECIQSSDGMAFLSIASELPSSLTLQNEVTPDDFLKQTLKSPSGNDSKKALANAQGFDASFTSKTAVLGTYERLKSEKQMNSNCGSSLDQLSSPFRHKNAKEISSPFRHKNAKEILTPSKEDARKENRVVESIVQKADPDLNFKHDHEFLPSNGTAVNLPTAIGSAASNTSGSTKSSSPLYDEILQARDMPDVAKEVKSKVTPKDQGTSDTPIKDLIAAAQAKAKRLLSRSTSFVDGKVFGDDVVSPSEMNRGDSSSLGSPQNALINHRPATDDRTHLQNGSRSPFVSQKDKGINNKLTAPVESNIARRSFEALLSTLSRTKESIGRATRVAMDCAKCGIAGEVLETVLRHLERESSLHKRIDLFFLVDSITQCSRSQKGGAGDAYLSLVQSVLPRLLSAAAPHGSAAWENRRQCLKVLRLWVERKTLPESIVRHHIRELESVTETSLTSSYSRRAPRTERALNDPIREMEGMFVDEYGSNTSFQLQNFIHPRLLEDEEGSGDDEKSFEAVTPERNAEIEGGKETAQVSNAKHRHILEDVDGELEMEDVAPPCGVEVNSGCPVEQHQSLPSAAPPLPEDLPPSPPPLPSSPPPSAAPCFSSHSSFPQQQLVQSLARSDATDFHLSGTNNIQNQQPQSIDQQANNFQGNSISSESVHYYNHGYGGFPKQIPPPPSTFASSGPYGTHTSINSGNDFQPKGNAPLPNKSYHLQPPAQSISNQFSYIQAEPQQRQPWGGPSFGDRYQYVHDPQGGNLFTDGNTRGPIQHEDSERGRFPSTINTGQVPSDGAGNLPSSLSCYGPPSESSSNPCHGWSIPPRISTYSVAAPRPSIENPNSQATGGYWRPR